MPVVTGLLRGAARRGGGGAGRAVPYVTRYTPKAVDRGWIGGALVQPLASAPALFLGWTPGVLAALGRRNASKNRTKRVLRNRLGQEPATSARSLLTDSELAKRPHTH